MALFKIFKGDGSAKALPTTKTDGFCYFTYNDGKFYVDYADASGTLQRRALNAAQADSAAKLTTARQVIIEGAVDGSVSSWNGSKDLRISVALNTTWADKINDAYLHAVTNKGSAFSAGLYKITTNAEGHVIAATAVTKSDITALGIPSTNTTYSVMSGASSSADGKAGLVPQPIKGQQNYFLAGNGSWAVPTNTTYGLSGKISGNTFVATLGAASTGTTATIPEATADTAGLMTPIMVSKLAGIDSGANKYVLPTASTTLGGVKTTSAVTSTSGLTASPIINGVVYYKNTTYSAATQSAAGLMSAVDKAKLDGIDNNANKYTLPVATTTTLGGIKAGGDITIDSTGVVSVKDDSHSHVISNVDGLSDAIQGAKDYADTAVANLVGSAPETLNTLEELANAINNSPDVMTAINNAIATKQDKITGAATTITSSNLTAARVLVSNSSGKVAASSSITTTELGYLDGVTGAIQGQLDAKVATGSAEYIKGLSISGRTITYTKGDGTTGTLTTQDNNTTYKAGTGLTLTSGTFNHTNAVTAATGVGEDGATRTLAFGGTFKVPTVSYDAQGHITGSGTVTLTMPANPNSDTKVKMTNTDPSAEGNWYLLGSSVAATSTDSVLKNNDLRIKVKNGTADTTGYVTLLLGNATASGTAGNKYGQLLLFSSNTGYHTIVGASTTGVVAHTLPATAGTLINTGNYTSYTVKKDGTGASGNNWAIGITGNAATATTATKLGTSDVGTATQPIYLDDGTPKACTYTLGKSVPSDAVFTDTNTKVTSVGNHYTPAADTSAVLSVDASSTTAATWNSTSLVTGVNIQRDAKGHVVGVTVDSVKMPSNPNSNTTYTLTGAADGNTWKTTLTSSSGSETTSVIPAATTSAAGLMVGADKTKLDNTNIAYGICETAAATAAKVITTAGNTNWKLTTGALVTILFTYTNTASNPTFNVNGTGAKNVFYEGARITTSNKGYAGTTKRMMTFVYDGTQYRFVSWAYDGNTNTYLRTYKDESSTYPILASRSAASVWDSTYESVYGTISSNITMTPSTGTITATTFAGTATSAESVPWSGVTSKPSYYDAKAIQSISRNGTTFTATHLDGTTSTFTQQDSDTKNTAGSTNSNSKLFLIGATSQAANPQTYSDSDVYTTDGTLTAKVFSGSGKQLTELRESYLNWGGTNISGGVSPVGAALSAEHSANRLAYLNPDALDYEYSDDGGSTWTAMSVSDTTKIGFVTTSGTVYVGNASTVTTNHRTRITLTAQDGTNGYVYTRPRKLLLNVSTSGHELTVKIEIKTGVSGASWTTVGEYALSGWSGWNDIPLSFATLGGGKTQTTHNWYMRLTFATTSVNSKYTTTKASIIGMRLFGDTCWTRTSNMGETGHLYSYDTAQNATFPAAVTATGGFSGSGASLTNLNASSISSGTIAAARLPKATTSTLGAVMLGYSASGKNYAIQADNNGKLYVNVPWTDNNTTYTFTNKAATLSWGSTTTIATIGDVDITVKMPSNPDTNTNYYHTRVYSTGLKISTGTGVNDMYVPDASDTQKGVTVVYPAAKCTTYTSDSGTVTPAAVKKAVGMFGVLNTGGSISGNLIFSNPDATGQSQHPNLTWNAIGANTPYIGYASDQSDGTFILGSIKGTNYATGLAIGGGSGNLLWKGNKVLTTADAYTLPTASSSTLGGVKIGTGISISNGVISNSGVRSIATGTTNGTISVNTNGTSTNIAVKGLGSAAYTASTAYDVAGAAAAVKNELLNGAGEAYDTLKELGDLISTNSTALEALETIADSKTPKTRAIPYIVGPSTDSAGAWTGTFTEIDAYTDGLTIIYVPGVAGHKDGTSLQLNSLDAIPCYVTNTSKLTTHFAAGTPIMLTYVQGQWRRADYDANNYAYARQYLTASSTTAYPILFRYDTAAPTNSDKYVTKYTRYATAITATPAGTLTATEFKGNLAASYITGTLGVAHGGTGATTLASGEALIGAGSGAVTTRGINNMTTKSHIAYDTKLMTTNTLAYWNGAYASSGASNLTYCNKGAFGDVVTKSYTDSSSASAISNTGTSVPTERDIYYGLPIINNSHSYTSDTTIYAPSAGGTAGQYLKAAGATSTPTWASFGNLTLKTTDTSGTTTTIGTYNSSAAGTLTVTAENLLPTYTSTHTSSLSANQWTTVTTPKGASNEEMGNGTYIIQVSTNAGEFYSGVMSWTKTTTVHTTIQYDEVVMHNAGTNVGYTHIGVRVYRDATTPKLQLCAIGDSSVSASSSAPITIKMRRII